MDRSARQVLVWLPSPMGDAILCTPALRAIREHFADAHIFLLGAPLIRSILSPSPFADSWLQQGMKNPFAIARNLREHEFTHAILLTNSFVSALATFLARVGVRIGYARGGRGFLLTERLHPPRVAEPDAEPGRGVQRVAAAAKGLGQALRNRFNPHTMVDYYLALAARAGASTHNRTLELSVAEDARQQLAQKLPALQEASGPVVILVPGGAFGPSKCWLPQRFAETADRLIEQYGATVVVSVAANEAERRIGRQICQTARHPLLNLGEHPLDLGQLKALFARADLVITNDTGPRHIAIALGRRVVTLFGPNDPAWTDTGYKYETWVVADVECAPCARPRCPKPEHICMKAITVDSVYEAAAGHLDAAKKRAATNG